MDSLRSTHARVAALARYRRPDDPEMVAARAELALCKEQTEAVRERIRSLPAERWAPLLHPLGKATAGV